MTIRQAVINVCKRYAPGQVVIARQIYRDTLDELWRNGYRGEPLQETVARRYREVAESCCMVTLPSKGQYQKQLIQLTKDELKIGQKALF
jgi:hypothetical protein